MRFRTHLARLGMAMSLTVAAGSGSAMPFNYGEALQKSIYFYEAQQAGTLPAWNRVPWRGDSVLNDGADVGLDLSGGWFDAGDHVKFGFPMASSVTMLAWGAVDYRNAYEQAGQLDDLLNNLRFVNDYFIAAHPTPNELYGQVGQGGPDHTFWGPAESAEEKTGASRLSFKIDLDCKGPDLAAETAAAMASSAMVFQATDANYANELIGHARDLYNLALATTGTDGIENNYANCITDAASFYNAGFGVYWDEMAWGALWMWRATGETFYRDKLIEFYGQMGVENQSTTPVFTWSQGWNDKAYGVYVLAARLLGDGVYHTDSRRYLDHWINPGGGLKTPDGLVVVDRFNGWGTMRYAANMAFLALHYADTLGAAHPDYARYHDFGVDQINYVLGDNPRNSSYVVGYGNNPPLNVHHRGAHGSWSDNINNPAVQRHILYGAVVGGPESADDFDYLDDRNDFRRNEVATDYNSGFTSAVARLYQEFGGDPIPDSQFPPAEGPFEEYLVGAKVNASSQRFTEIKAVIQNKSTAPAQVRDDLFFRYFVDLSEAVSGGLSASDITVSTAFNQGTSVSQLQVWGNPSDNIYYTEVSFAGVRIYPGGQSQFRREVQFRMSLPNDSSLTWDDSNDPSWDPTYASNNEQFGITAPRIPVYGNNGLLFGEEPSPACGPGTGLNCIPTATDSSVSTSFETPVSVALSGNDSDGSITSRTIVSAPSNGTVSGTGATRTYTPNAGFDGTDSFSFTVTDNGGATSDPATVTITVEPAVLPTVNISSPAAGSSVTTGSEFSLNYSSTNTAQVRLSVAGTVIGPRPASGPTTVTAPTTAGNFTVTLTALDGNGDALNASDAITLNAVTEQTNQDPLACFSVETVSPTVGAAVTLNASCSSDPDNDTLTYQWSFGDNASGNGNPASHTYSAAGPYNVTLTVDDGNGGTNSTTQQVTVAPADSGGNGSCSFVVENEWNSGFVGKIVISNSGSQVINGWQVGWTFSDDSTVANLWNANFTNTKPYSASNLSWNGQIQPNQSVEFGFVGNKASGGGSVPTVNITGSVCQ